VRYDFLRPTGGKPLTTFPSYDENQPAQAAFHPEWAATRRKAVRGLGWQALNTLLRQLATFLTGIVLARLLSPEEFGLVGIAVMFSFWIGILGDAGVGAALIQREMLAPELVNAGFWVASGVGLLSGAVLVVVSPAVSHFYGYPGLIPIMAVYAVSLWLGGLNAIPGALLRRQLDFRRVSMVEVAGTVTSGGVAILLASQGFASMSIPIGSAAGLLMALTLYGVLRLFPPVRWPTLSAVRQLGRFPIFASGARAAEVLRVTIDNAFVGKFLGATPLGFYGFGFNLISIPEYRLVGLVTQVAFPTLANIRADLTRVRELYLRLLRLATLVVLPLLVGLRLVADRLVPLVYGSRWEPAVPLIQVLCFAGVCSALAVLTDSPMLALGHAAWTWRANVLWVIALGVGLYVVLITRQGLIGVAWAVSLVALLVCLLRNFVTMRLCLATPRMLLGAILPSIVAALAMTASVAVLQRLCAWVEAGWGTVLGIIGAGGLIYTFIALLLLPELRHVGQRLLVGKAAAAK
jgi:PST family polysaccharide transporter